MSIRNFSMAVSAIALAAVLGVGPAAAADVIKLGASAPKTGPLAGPAAVTHWPNIHLWVKNVNEAGGIKVGDKMMTVELVEYDDQTTPGEAVKNYERMATVDQVDFVMAPYSTGINLAVAPILAKHGYPMITSTAVSDSVAEFASRWDNTVWLLGTAAGMAESVADVLSQMRDAGTIGDKVAVVNVADAFGLDLVKAGKPALEAAGFDIAYETSYPLGTQDLAPVVNGAKNADVDAFVAFSYPPDTFALTEQAKISNLDVKAFYVGVAAAFPAYLGAFGSSAEGILGIGGVNLDLPATAAYYEDHNATMEASPDYWASPVAYASLQVLQQAIERAGTLDRAAVNAEIRNGTFETVAGTITLEDGVNNNFWTVGQWQGGAFKGVAALGIDGAVAPVAKEGWE